MTTRTLIRALLAGTVLAAPLTAPGPAQAVPPRCKIEANKSSIVIKAERILAYSSVTCPYGSKELIVTASVTVQQAGFYGGLVRRRFHDQPSTRLAETVYANDGAAAFGQSVCRHSDLRVYRTRTVAAFYDPKTKAVRWEDVTGREAQGRCTPPGR